MRPNLKVLAKAKQVCKPPIDVDVEMNQVMLCVCVVCVCGVFVCVCVCVCVCVVCVCALCARGWARAMRFKGPHFHFGAIATSFRRHFCAGSNISFTISMTSNMRHRSRIIERRGEKKKVQAWKYVPCWHGSVSFLPQVRTWSVC